MRLIEMLSAVAREMLGSLLADLRLLAVYALVVLVFLAGYKKYMELKDSLGDSYGKSKWRLLEESVLTGLVCGFILSVISVLLGITISVMVVEYFLFIIIILAIINIRYVGFIYVGGVLVIVNAIANKPQFDSVSLLALMGMVQLTESVLIFLYGKTDAVPVYIKHNGRIAGAFVIRKVWPIPIVFFTYALGEIFTAVQQEFTAEWWTLLKPHSVIPAAAALGLDCLIAVAGYWDISIAESPELRSRKTSYYLAGIALFLFAASAIAYSIPSVAYIAALLSMAAKEWLVIWGRRAQKRRAPLFASEDRGLKLLEVMDGSNAKKIGLEKGDVILTVNGRDIQTIEGLKAALSEYPVYIWIDVLKPDGSKKTCEKSFYPYGIDSLGVLTVPRESEVTYNIDSYENLVILRNLVRKFRGISRSMKD